MRWGSGQRQIWFMFLAALLLLPGCKSAFAPSSGDTDSVDLDVTESEPEPEMEPDEETTVYNLRISPDFQRQGETFQGEITFRNLDEVKEKLHLTGTSIPTWNVDFGADIGFLLIRFDPEALRFYDIQAVVSATARTGERIISARIANQGFIAVEYGRFFVLPSLENSAGRDNASPSGR